MFFDLINPYLEYNVFSGVVRIEKEDNILFHKAFGLANRSHHIENTIFTKFHIASVSKPFTAVAIMQLIENEKISLESTIDTFIPKLNGSNKITIEHLLRHYSGLPNMNAEPKYDEFAKIGLELKDLIEYITKFETKFEPGSRYDYSNTNYNILAYIIETISNLKFGEYLAKYIFDPLQMFNTIHHDNPKQIIENLATGYEPIGKFELQKSDYLNWSIKIGNGSLISTTEDLSKFIKGFQNNKVISNTSREAMIANNMGLFSGEIQGHVVFGINGRSPGYTSKLIVYPESDTSIIILSNNYTGNVVDEMANKITSKLFNHEIIHPKIPKIVNVKRDILESRTGKYSFDKDSFSPGSLFKIENNGESWIYSNNFSTSEIYPTSNSTGFSRIYWCHAGFEENRFYFEFANKKHYADKIE